MELRYRKWTLTLAALAVALTAALHSGPLAAEEQPVPRRPIEEFLVDQPAKEFQSKDLRGNVVSLADFRGRVLIVNFWGIWCPPCREELPELAELYRELEPRGLAVLAVNTGDPREQVPPYVEKEKLPFPVVFDEGASELYEIVAFPTSYVLDRTGRVRYIAEGYTPRTVRELELIVTHLLDASSGDAGGNGGGDDGDGETVTP